MADKRYRFCTRAVVLSLVGVMAACGTACGQKSGVPESGSAGGFDTVFTGPTAWDGDEESEEIPETEQNVAEPESSDVSVEPEVSTESSVSENQIETEESVPEGSEPVSEGVPQMADLLGLSSVDATQLMAGQLRGDIIVAWGNPNGKDDMHLHANDDKAGHDKWTVQTTSGPVDIHLRYGYADEKARVIEAYTRYEGWDRLLFENIQASEFMEFATNTADMVPVLSEMGNLTRHDVIEVLGWPEGCYFTQDEVFVGDVFEIFAGKNDMGGFETAYYLMVEYDEQFQSYPVGLTFLRFVGDDGRKLKYPEIPEEFKYSLGKYNQGKFKHQWIDLP